MQLKSKSREEYIQRENMRLFMQRPAMEGSVLESWRASKERTAAHEFQVPAKSNINTKNYDNDKLKENKYGRTYENMKVRVWCYHMRRDESSIEIPDIHSEFCCLLR